MANTINPVAASSDEITLAHGAFRINVAVPDGGQGVDAEEERVRKSAHVGLKSLEVVECRS